MKRFMIIGLFLSVPFLLVAQNNTILSGGCVGSKTPQHFYEKMEAVNSQLYKISAGELQDYLGCSYPHIPVVSANELKDILKNQKHVLVINVLPKNLYDDCHIDGSIGIPLKELVEAVKDWPRDTEIVVYCALDICDAGKKAYVILSCMGFINVIDYEGGIKEWFQLGFATCGPANSSYLHARYAKLPDELIHELVDCCSIELPRNQD